MPSRVEALVRNFLKTDGEALCLVVGERLYLRRGGAKTIVGREPLSFESFKAIADELAPGELVDSLVESGHRVPFQLDEGSETVVVEFGTTGTANSMTVVRAAVEESPAPQATAFGAGAPEFVGSSANAGDSARAGSYAGAGSYASAAPSGSAQGGGGYALSGSTARPASVPRASEPESVFGTGGPRSTGSSGQAGGSPSPTAASIPVSPAPSAPVSRAAPAGGTTPTTASIPVSPAPSALASAPVPRAVPVSPSGASESGIGGSRPSSASLGRSNGGTEKDIDKILLKMLADEASDLHLSACNRPAFRVHGEIVPQDDFAELSSSEVGWLLDPVFPEKNRSEFEERNDTDFAYEIPGVSRFRVNVFRDRKGVGAVFRQIPVEVKSAAQLNLPPAVIGLGDLSKGLVLVTGPTGSGKSTTLAAIVDHINSTRTDHIITIEDPIEFVHANKKCLVNQREIGTHTRGFKDALRAALREDPDIVLVGEMRDLETIAIAIETAETGHLVFGTLHTMTAASTVDRIVDQFPEDRQAQIRVMLADSLRAVVSQTLLRKKTGGRIAALEILLSNGAVANLVRDGKTFQLQSVMQTSKAQGMVLLNDALLDLVKKGIVEPKEAYQKAVDKVQFLAAMKTANVPLGDLRPEAGSTPQPNAAAGASSAPAPAGASR